MRVLVTGGGGFAGRHLLRELLKEPASAVAATVLGDPPVFGARTEFGKVEWLSLDIADPSAVNETVAAFDPDQIYHLAGQASVGESFENPLATWQVNATGTVNTILAAGSRSGRRFLLASSAEVYGVSADRIGPVDEEAPAKPMTPYGISKAAAEMAALRLGELLGVEVIVARSFNHIGPGQDRRFVLPSMAGQLAAIGAVGASSVVQVGNLDVERDFLDVRDVASAYATLMRAASPGEVYNVASGRANSLAAVVRRLVELSGTDATLEVDPERFRAADIPRLVGSADKLGKLGWSPRVDLDDTLRDLLREATAGK